MTWSTLGRPLDPITQDACAFYKKHAVYKRYNGVVLDYEEGKQLGELLEGNKAQQVEAVYFRETIDADMLGCNLDVLAPMAFFLFSGWMKSFYGDLHGPDGVKFYTRKKMLRAP